VTCTDLGIASNTNVYPPELVVARISRCIPSPSIRQANPKRPFDRPEHLKQIGETNSRPHLPVPKGGQREQPSVAQSGSIPRCPMHQPVRCRPDLPHAVKDTRSCAILLLTSPALHAEDAAPDKREAMFKRHDTNGDGSISKEEWMSSKGAKKMPNAQRKSSPRWTRTATEVSRKRNTPVRLTGKRKARRPRKRSSSLS